jgi:hypothetical protein
MITARRSLLKGVPMGALSLSPLAFAQATSPQQPLHLTAFLHPNLVNGVLLK